MNLRKSGRILGVVAAIAMLAMVLQGCGGDDGVSESLYDQTAMERDAALAAQAAAEEAAAAARKAAEEAQAAAAIDKEAAEAALQAAQDAEAAAAAAKEAAEQAQADKATAEQARADAEKALQDAQAAEATALMSVQTAASEAAAAAQTASDNASDEAQDAMDAVMHLATGGQTNAMAAMYAEAAQDAADAAMDDATDAQAASDDAAAATDIAMAIAARDKAVAAQEMAESHEMTAETESADAQTAAAMELMIHDMEYSVGDSSVMIDEETQDVTVSDKRTITGLLDDMNIATSSAEIPGVQSKTTPDPDDKDAPGARARDLDVGVTYDAGNDAARLALVTQYAGTMMVTAYMDGADALTGTKPNMVDNVDHDSDSQTDDQSVPLMMASGTFVMASALETNGWIAADTKPVTVYYYETTASDGRTEKTYVRSTGTDVDGSGTTYKYQEVNIQEGAKIPAAMDYAHIHFGVWAGLKEANDITGVNAVGDLGIGFVQNHSGGMTETMPNHGSATYMGNWVATVRAAANGGLGAITLQDGAATIKADFEDMEVDVMLANLVDLEGNIDGNTFSGEDAMLADSDTTNQTVDNTSGLALDGKFTGTFSGAFYGDLAAEAGGVFDFTSKDMEDGEFRGAFGGARGM